VNVEARRERVLAVLEVARACVDPSSAIGRSAREALEATSGLAPAGVELALSRHLETHAAEDELASLLASVGTAPRCHVVLAANVCTAAVRALALAVATAPDVVVRPSRRDPGLAPLFVRELEVSGRFRLGGGSIRLATEIDAAPGDEVHAYGSDASMDAIGAALPRNVIFRPHGTGLGVAVIARGADVANAAELLAADVVPFDQRGCLSPRVAIVIGDASRARAFSSALAAALSRASAAVPRGELDTAATAELATFRTLATSLGEPIEDRDHLVAFFPDAPPVPLPPPCRAVSVIAADAPEIVRDVVAPMLRFVTTIGGSTDDDATRSLEALPGVRYAQLGKMQSPPLDGPVDRRAPAERGPKR
jgi:hypothetical protein